MKIREKLIDICICMSIAYWIADMYLVIVIVGCAEYIISNIKSIYKFNDFLD